MTPLKHLPKFAFDQEYNLYKKRAVGWVKVTPYEGVRSQVLWPVIVDKTDLAILKQDLIERGANAPLRERHNERREIQL